MFRLRPFQYSLRTLLLVVTAFSIACSWLGVRLRDARRQAAAVKEIESLGGAVYYASQEGRPAPEFIGVRPVHGNDLWGRVRAVCFGRPEACDEALPLLADLRGLQSLIISGPNKMTDAGFAGIGKLTTLNALYIENVQLTDAGVAQLGSLTRLEVLELRGVSISDAGLVHLTPLRGLKCLTISETPITDAGIAHLEGLDSLEDVRIPNTKISKAGAERLKERLPRCKCIVTEWNR